MKSYCAIHNEDESKNLGDITKVDETKLKPFNMICGGSPCFVKGTKVLTDVGYKNIEDIKVGDMVLTHKNRYMPVVRTGGEYNKEIYSLKCSDSLTVECTDYHPFYCKRTKDSTPEKVRLFNLEIGYYLGSHINCVNLDNLGISKEKYFIENDIVWYQIKEIANTRKIEDVYNIEVEEDHTYTANNIITYNCQDFSVAGKQKGSVWTCKDCGHEYNPLTVHWSKRYKCPNCGSENLEKTRSSLLVEYLRVIRANKPNFGMYENVKNIVGKQFRETTFKLFTDELEEYGYNVYWKVLNAKNYGIPQNRERVYLIFIKKELDNGKFKFPEAFDNGIRLKDILENEVDEKYYISEDKVKKFLENLHVDNSECESNAPHFIGNVNRADFGTGYAGGVWDTNNISPTLTTMQGGGRQPHVMQGIDKSLNQTKCIDVANCLTSREDGGISNRKSEGTAVIEYDDHTVLLTKCGENLDKQTEYANTLLARDYKGFGNQSMNAVIKVPQATKKGYIECEIGGVADLSYPESKTRRGRVQDNGNVCPTLTATETGVCRIESAIRIRKLTPKECFRLMGFSDENFEAAEKVVSNSQLYKQAGNSIVTDVLYYILVELYKTMPYLFDELKLSSYFSGIGAFEIALNRLYEGINSGNFINPRAE